MSDIIVRSDIPKPPDADAQREALRAVQRDKMRAWRLKKFGPTIKKPPKTKEEKLTYERELYARNAEKVRERKRKGYENNRDRELERNRKYRENNSEKVKAAQRRWIEENREKRAQIIRDYHNKRSATDPTFKLLRSIRARLRRAIAIGSRSGSTIERLGCTIDELKVHLENQFLPGMSWANHGRTGWHIDHIKSLSTFDLTDPVQLFAACHYTNLQPLWWQDNLKKGAK